MYEDGEVRLLFPFTTRLWVDSDTSVWISSSSNLLLMACVSTLSNLLGRFLSEARAPLPAADLVAGGDEEVWILGRYVRTFEWHSINKCELESECFPVLHTEPPDDSDDDPDVTAAEALLQRTGSGEKGSGKKGKHLTIFGHIVQIRLYLAILGNICQEAKSLHFLVRQCLNTNFLYCST